ncbi:MAG: alpha/beta fold hydrolase [Candidatus Micrarchaeota archaeon]
MKVFLFHCWGGDGKSCWSFWLSNRLKERGIEVISPDFPDTNTPKLEKWLVTVRNNVKKFNKKDEWVLIGHSLGCPTILSLLESFDQDEHVKKVILVAGSAKDLGIPELKNFFDMEFDFEKIKTKSDKFIVINSDNDPFIELSEGERVAKILDADFIIEKNAGHINSLHYGRLLELI